MTGVLRNSSTPIGERRAGYDRSRQHGDASTSQGMTKSSPSPHKQEKEGMQQRLQTAPSYPLI